MNRIVKHVFLVAVLVTTQSGGSLAQNTPEKPLTGMESFGIPAQEIPRFEAAALAGDPVAAFRLAQFYGFNKANQAENFYWLSIAAENGHLAGMHNYGFTLANKDENERGRQRAIYWMKRAAKAGNSDSATYLKIRGIELE